jgi:divalent metal cation (Fe/Co/Zn/Cd) transporter
MDVAGELQSSRTSHLKIGVWLAAATVAWNLAEGAIAVGAGAAARSIALIAFGMDSFIETASGALLGWRFVRELRGNSGNHAVQIERRTSRVAGGLLLLLAAYILIDAGVRLLGYAAEPRSSVVGVIVTATALVVMPVLAWLKLRIARELGSRALRTDAFESITCAGLSATTLAGLVTNLALGLDMGRSASSARACTDDRPRGFRSNRSGQRGGPGLMDRPGGGPAKVRQIPCAIWRTIPILGELAGLPESV